MDSDSKYFTQALRKACSSGNTGRPTCAPPGPAAKPCRQAADDAMKAYKAG